MSHTSIRASIFPVDSLAEPAVPVLARGHLWIPLPENVAVDDPTTGQIVAELPALAEGATSLTAAVADKELWLGPLFADAEVHSYVIEDR